MHYQYAAYDDIVEHRIESDELFMGCLEAYILYSNNSTVLTPLAL